MEFDLWVRIIKESIEQKNVDPWNVNISEITDQYLGTIRELRKFDIRLSADVVLVAGILLRLKSQVLYGECENAFKEEVEDNYDDEEYLDEEYLDDQIVEPIEKKQKEPKLENMTLDGLISTLKTELKKIKEIKPRKKREIVRPTELYRLVEEMIEEDDISDLMEFMILELKKSGGKFIFQNKFKTRDELIKNFLPVLYLANDGKIDLEQETLFEELSIELKK
ncbi:chromosome segregation and condensation protein ScpA [Methanococcus vannielii SB]|uniref:Chromosome segregation and condensation protein ScpA n=1 Tax=Methanococcus vannielii (strain ATCC 35089 / DSM 1224 / JCM 13029 / OCM 148 / SB) TaxID=406327 RepID=A6UQG3_METVS|nr:ScpA family protein [Methanococcus vannielii]ABR54735.1 chromosome segregation and condensation protein ScpA [Methanococcus vannielii SB]